VAGRLLDMARSYAKPVVVDFVGYDHSLHRTGNLWFASTFDEAAELAVRLAGQPDEPTEVAAAVRFAPGQRYLRGLYSGGTLAYEAQLLLRPYLPRVYSNAPLDKQDRLPSALTSQGHTIVDLGNDELTVGRLHPMMDNALRIRRMQQEAADPEVAVLLLDLVLGHGAHPDPAGELAPAIAAARAQAAAAGRTLEVVAVVVGTGDDPQGLDAQVARLAEAGARVEMSHDAATRTVGRLLASLQPEPPAPPALRPVDLAVLNEPLAAVNAGLESFAESLQRQGARVVHVDWRPPAGGNERLAAILERMKRK